MHGSTMMFLFAVPMLEGFAILLLPMLLGNREMPFPRLGAFSFWIFLGGGLLFYASFLFGAVPDAGWFAYVPLSGPRFSPGLALDFWLLALSVAEIGAIATGHRAHHLHPAHARAGHDAQPDAALCLGHVGHGLRDPVRIHAADGGQRTART